MTDQPREHAAVNLREQTKGMGRLLNCCDCSRDLIPARYEYGEIADGVFCCIECLVVRAKQVEHWKMAVNDQRRERRTADKQRRMAYHEWQAERVAFKREAVHDHLRRVCQERDAIKALLPEHVWKEALGIQNPAAGAEGG